MVVLYGVHCDSSLALLFRRAGIVPPEFAELTQLQVLDISNTTLTSGAVCQPGDNDVDIR